MKCCNITTQGTLKKHGMPIVLAASMALAACGGGGGGSSSSDTTDDTTTAQLQSVSGTVEKPTGVTIAERSIVEELLAALGSVVSPLQADVGGLEPAANVDVQLVRLNDDGTVAEVLTNGATDGNGEFTLSADFTATGDLVVIAGTTDPIRAPAGGDNVQVNPVSETIVRKVLDLVASGSAFSDFSATELAVLVNVILDELDAAGVDFSGATSVDDAVTTADNGAGTTDDELVADSEGDPNITLAGGMNIVNLGFETEVVGSEANISITSENIPTTFVDGPGLDFSGQTITVFDSVATWNFADASSFDFQVSQSVTEETVPGDEPPVFLSIGSSGRLATEDGGKGAISSDGGKFVFSDTDDNDFANIVFGVVRGDPGTVNETYNIVSYVPTFDNTLNDAVGDNDPTTVTPGDNEFFPAQVGNLIGTRHSLTINCSSGNCTYDATDLDGGNLGTSGDFATDVETGATTNAPDQRYYVQSGPEGFRVGDGGPDAGHPQFQIYPSFLENFSDAIAVSSSGVLSEDTGSQATRGFLAADGSMILLQFETNDAATGQQFPGFPGTAIYIGLPKGDSCDNTTLSGTYNVATHASIHSDTDEGGFDGTFATETNAFSVEFDGSGGIQVPDIAVQERVLAFGSDPVLSASTFTAAGDSSSTYSVNADCTVTIVDEGGAKGTHLNGMVSPDGESIVLGDFTNEGNLSGDVFIQLLAGFRAPAS